MTNKKRISKLERLVEDLARALLLHARTDVQPDAALPSLRKLVKRATKAVRNG